MKHLLRQISLGVLAVSPVFAGYSYRSSVAFSGASRSTQTNITLLFSFNDSKLKSFANGGEIRNFCVRNSLSVPCDFVFTNDATCATITGGYAWGFDGDYSPTAGTGHGWIRMPSYTTSGVSPTVCIGNSAINGYLGGSVGAEFDASTKLALHLSNGSTLSLADASASANTSTNSGATAGTGKVDGGASTNGTSQGFNTSTTDFGPGITATVDFWLNKPSYANNDAMAIEYGGGANSSGQWEFFIDPNGSGGNFEVDSRSGAGFDSDATFVRPSPGMHHYAIVFNVAIPTHQVTAVYVDGVSQTLSYFDNSSGLASLSAQAANFMSRNSSSLFTAGTIDEVRFSSTARSADWIATEYANQSTPPTFAGFIAVSSPGPSSPVPAAIY